MSELDKEYLLVNGTEAHPPPTEAVKRPFFAGTRASNDTPDEEAEKREDEDGKDDTAAPEKKARRVPIWAYALMLIRDHELWSGDALSSFALRLGDSRLVSLCMQRSPGSIVEKARYVSQADAWLGRAQKTRIDLLRSAASNPCTCDRLGDWKTAAIEVLQLQNIPTAAFASAMLSAL